MTHLWTRQELYSPSIVWGYLPTTFTIQIPWSHRYMLKEMLDAIPVDNWFVWANYIVYSWLLDCIDSMPNVLFLAYSRSVLPLPKNVSWKIWQYQHTVDSFQLWSFGVSVLCLGSTRPQEHTKNCFPSSNKENKIIPKLFKSLCSKSVGICQRSIFFYSKNL